MLSWFPGEVLVKVDAIFSLLRLPLVKVDASFLCFKLPLVKVDMHRGGHWSTLMLTFFA